MCGKLAIVELFEMTIIDENLLAIKPKQWKFIVCSSTADEFIQLEVTSASTVLNKEVTLKGIKKALYQINSNSKLDNYPSALRVARQKLLEVVLVTSITFTTKVLSRGRRSDEVCGAQACWYNLGFRYQEYRNKSCSDMLIYPWT